MTISIFGCGWSGLPLLQELASSGHSLKGSTTTPEKVDLIEKAGGKGFLFSATPEGLTGKEVRDFFTSEVVIVTLPPPRSSSDPEYALKVHRAIAEACRDVPLVILFSSSSVYPDLNRVVLEEDAQRLSSPHSGVVMLDLEAAYDICNGKVYVLRFGGLFGADRKPGNFLRNAEIIKNSEAPVNMTHLDEILSAVPFLLTTKPTPGPYNLCSPVHPSRGEFYSSALSSLGLRSLPGDGRRDRWKEVSVEKIQQAGYSFVVQDPGSNL